MRKNNIDAKYFKDIIELIDKRIDSRIGNIPRFKCLSGIVKSVDNSGGGNNENNLNTPGLITSGTSHADVEVLFGDNPVLLKNLSNKTGVALNINDEVYVVAPTGDFASCYIDKSKVSFPTINGALIQGDWDASRIVGDLSRVDNITNLLKLAVNSIDSNNLINDKLNTNYSQTAFTNAIIQYTANNGNKLYYTHNYTENWLSDAGVAGTIDNTIAININPIFLESVTFNLTTLDYIVKFYPTESCNYSITKTATNFTITTDKDVEFGYEIMAKRKGFESVKLEDAQVIEDLT